MDKIASITVSQSGHGAEPPTAPTDATTYPEIRPEWHPFHVAGHVGYMEGEAERCHFYHRTVWAVDRDAAEASERLRLGVAWPQALHINLLVNPVSSDEIAAITRYYASRPDHSGLIDKRMGVFH